jgi:tRNA-splicing ligase RtcB
MIRIDTLDPYTRRIPVQGGMKVPVTLFLSAAIRVEEDALRQIMDTASLDAESLVLATPDIHTGYGVPIGSVFASPHLLSPSAVGYDINCGMRLLATPLTRGGCDAAGLAAAIHKLIPLGEGKKNLRCLPAELAALLKAGLKATPALLRRQGLADDDITRVEDEGSLAGCVDALPPRALERGLPQLGTLGGGNHFIEIQTVAEIADRARAERLGLRADQIMVMIHSGSRGLGHEVAGDFLKLAKEEMRRRGEEPPNSQITAFAADTPAGRRYLGAMNAAANFAFANRQVMALLVQRAFSTLYGPQAAARVHTVYDVTHNIAKVETHHGRRYFVHRKGATRAFDAERMRGTPFADCGQPVLIPGSMGSASYVLLGCRESARSLYSVNHGAGRRLSRSAAAGKKGRPGAISDAVFKSSMAGITLICDDRSRIKEEAPAAYKDIEEVVAVVVGAGLALPVAKLKPLAVLKG